MEENEVMLVNPDGTFAEGWLDVKVENEDGEEVNLFDDEVRNDQLTKSFKGLPDLVKNYRSAQKLVGRNKIIIPEEGAPDEEWDNVFKTLGMPEKAEDYKLDFAETVPEDLRKKENLDWYHQEARKYRLLPWQATGLFNDWNELQAGTHKKTLDEFNASLEVGMAKLKDKLGATFNERMEAVDAIINAGTDSMKRLGFADDEIEDISERLMNDSRRDPRVAGFLASIGEMISEDRMGKIEKQNLFGMRPSQAQEQIEEINTNPEHPYWKKEHPGHKAAVAKMQALMRIVTGGK